MTDGVLLRETLKDSDLDKYRYEMLRFICQYGAVAIFLLTVIIFSQCNCDG